MSLVKFNEYAKEFLLKMKDTFPEENKIQLYYSMFLMFECADQGAPLKMFMENLRPFGLQIMTKDEHFFKDDQYVNAAESISGKMGLIDHWDSCSKETQNAIWKYMQILYSTGMVASGLSDELSDIINQRNKLHK